MSVKYDPEATLVDATWVAVLLSERDVAGQIPINFVTNPAVSLSAACFGDGLYDREAAAKCISNLLAVGYRRLVLDLYWSVERRKWSFCPVSIPARADVTVSSFTSTATESSETSTMTTAETTTASDTAPPVITGTEDSHGDTVFALGKYRCTSNLDLETLAEVLVGYFQDTTNQLVVYTTYLVLNLHVAASSSAPNDPVPAITGDKLPKTQTERAGSYLGMTLRDFIYSPVQLAKDRSNLNESWYKVSQSYMPITEYFTVHENKAGQQSTPDGWPSAKYIQLAKRDRVLIEYGSVDPQLAEYDLSEDENAIFPPGSMTSKVDISAASNGSLTSGCLYRPGATDVSQANTSWAGTSRIPVKDGLSTDETMGSLADSISGITACGLSPLLNNTLFGQTADANVAHYCNVSLSTAWAWAIGEPLGADAGGNSDNQLAPYRCAIMDVSLNGRWRAVDCTNQRRGACRVGHSPFSWELSSSSDYFSNVSKSCPDGSTLAVPRTSLENTYLYKHLLDQSPTTIDPTSTNPALREIYLDLNSIDIVSCWVTGGPRARCPYAADPQQLQRKTVLIATIAAIVIFIISALTLFVKCNANRRNSRRRKRVIQGWEYEGVPS
ncbi:hypothetical protein NUU61_010114 [Penicillium alfredii]|uniref:Maintenance of telomere capping protein 6 n=1 Tax=Penicillium alfredii TaxID=1506179 RepID=A0A9W9EHM9_9EURO|nr:uncharacterized protein NUU61_010114 [Penicillium alfredii]KAJ5081850.1 hypothetical protein NUU61_010114 [Penicillium alfredii]